MDTVDGADNAQLKLSGGGSPDKSRGGWIGLYGNEASNGDVNVNLGTGASAGFNVYDSSGTAAARVVGSTGNVGIGTTTASEKLEVNGNVKMGWENVHTDCPNNNKCTCNCSAGKQLTGGGCADTNETNHLIRAIPFTSSYYCVYETVQLQVTAYCVCANIR